MVEKPFAASAADARRMIAAMDGAAEPARRSTGRSPGIPRTTPPSGWSTRARSATLIEVHFYDGNRGPLYHLADKVEVSPEEVERQKPGSWWYKQAAGGGSLLDYLGYGTTLGTWFLDGEAPVEVTCVVDETPGIEVDQHSITVCRYARGLSKFETRWGTLTDPWTHPAAAEMRLRAGRHATARSRATTTTTSSRCRPGQAPAHASRCRSTRCRPAGARADRIHARPDRRRRARSPGRSTRRCRLIGQRIIDSAVLSAREKRTVPLVP